MRGQTGVDALALPRVRALDFLLLTKPRIVVFIMASMAAGFIAAVHPQTSLLVLLHALVGTAIVAGAANALNQVFERDVDAVMARTAARPVAAGRLSPAAALTLAVFAWGIGVVYLATLVNLATAAVAFVTVVSYAFIYTPMKRVSSLATLVGAVPGALPIVGGWLAAGGRLGAEVWALFWIMFLWQLPHFLAIGWMYREDYRRAGLRMLSVEDPSGGSTFRQAALYAVALLPVSLAPTLLGTVGLLYFAGALLTGGWYAWAALAALRGRTRDQARSLFLVSIAYLPLLIAFLVADRLLI